MLYNDFCELFSGFTGSQEDLMPILHKVQAKYGYISKEAVRQISQFLKISENQIYGVASFYSHFRFNEPGRHSIKICKGTTCYILGGEAISQAIEKELGITIGQTTTDKRFDLQEVECLGCCALSPAIQIDDDLYSRMTVDKIQRILDKYV